MRHKLINNWLSDSAKPEKSAKHGTGVFAVKEIPKDELIAIFGSHIITRAQRDKLPENVKYLALGIDNDMFIGPISIKETDDADWFNHSCGSNAGLKGQIMLVAMKDIRKGEEITFDYCVSCSQLGDKRILFKCDCGSDLCRGEVTNHDWRNPELQKRYKGYFSYFVQRNIDNLG